jgi:putative transposase
MEFPELSKQYWGKHFWAIGYGVWSTGNVSKEMVEEYLEHHRTPSNKDLGNMMLE